MFGRKRSRLICGPSGLVPLPRPPCRLAWAIALSALLPAFVSAAPHETRIPLKDGKVPFSELSATLCRELDITSSRAARLPLGEVDLNGAKGEAFVLAMNGSLLGDGLTVALAPGALVLHIDPAKLPKDGDTARRAVRLMTAIEAPESTAALQKHYGLHLPALSPPVVSLSNPPGVSLSNPSNPSNGPPTVDARRPLVVLIHGLDSDGDMWGSLADLLARDGRQVATFSYPSDGPIDEDATRLAGALIDLRRSYPGLRVDIITHSMGGLVARDYVEGPDYPGGVDRLIMLATPNTGSSWARWRFLLGVMQQYRLWRTDPDWGPSWIIDDGLGEAGDDLMPGSKFLTDLNARPRRSGVRYTIVAGNQCPASEIGAGCFERTSACVPQRARQWWGFRQCKAHLDQEADALRVRTGDSDGPVTLKSAELQGVSDFVIVPADHVALACGDPPAAWGVIRDRLAR
jgi:pimeloyl-ACP methyl ester carboxylesterase